MSLTFGSATTTDYPTATLPLSQYFFGIDPGINGGIALLEAVGSRSPQLVWAHTLPTVHSGTHYELNLHDIDALLDDPRFVIDGVVPQVFIELVHAAPRQGVVSMFRFGWAAGALAGLVVARDYPLTYFTPQRWQKAVGVKPDPDAGRLRASQLFPPKAELFARKKDQHRADAALIAYAGWLSHGTH